MALQEQLTFRYQRYLEDQQAHPESSRYISMPPGVQEQPQAYEQDDPPISSRQASLERPGRPTVTYEYTLDEPGKKRTTTTRDPLDSSPTLLNSGSEAKAPPGP